MNAKRANLIWHASKLRDFARDCEKFRGTVVYLWELMKVAHRILIAALTTCLLTVWTCPVYCSTAPGHSEPGAMIEMIGHEHHHMSEMRMPLDGPSLKAIHRHCCEQCGVVDPAVGATEKRLAAQRATSTPGNLVRPIAGLVMVDAAPVSPPSAQNSSPPGRSFSPLRI